MIKKSTIMDWKYFSAMSRRFKVHEYFELDEQTKQEPCICSSPQGGYSKLGILPYLSEKERTAIESYNISTGGSILSEDDVVWENLNISECEM